MSRNTKSRCASISDKLGGNMRLAAFPPGKGDISNMIRSYITKCEKTGVEIKMNTKVDDHTIETGTVLSRAAELVCAIIHGRGKELADQIRVACVDLDDVETSDLGSLCGFAVLYRLSPQDI